MEYTVKFIDFEPVQGLTTASSWTTGEVSSKWTGKILVPFAIDAPFSGVGRILRVQRSIMVCVPLIFLTNWKKKNVLFHFAASDWETSIYVNGEKSTAIVKSIWLMLPSFIMINDFKLKKRKNAVFEIFHFYFDKLHIQFICRKFKFENNRK